MKQLSRRQLLGSAGLMAGTGFVLGGTAPLLSKEDTPAMAKPWTYVRLEPATVADEAAKLYRDGGCMYGVFTSIVSRLGRMMGEPFASFPFYMMRYGEGGTGGFGSLCGALNGAAAAVGLFEQTKERREQLIGELCSWYETTALPVYRPAAPGTVDVPKSVAGSVLCHMSVSHWCKVASCDVLAKERKERCSRITADVATKAVELLNRNLLPSPTFNGLSADVKSCLSCHGKQDLRDTQGKMGCNACHKFSKKHP
jgi:hypothetical protein